MSLIMRTSTRLAAVFLIALVAHDGLAQGNRDNLQQDFVSAWLVTVEGDVRTRTLNITEAEIKQDSRVGLAATYGWTDGRHTPVQAEATITQNGYRLSLTTQVGSQIFAETSGSIVFTGTFTNKSGLVKNVRLERISPESLAKLRAELTAPRVPCNPKPIVADVSGSAAGNPAARPRFTIGDCWQIRITDLLTNEETQTYEDRIRGLTADKVELERVVLSSKRSTLIGRRSRISADPATLTSGNCRVHDCGIVKGTYVAFSFPLDLGKTWQYEYEYRLRDGDRMPSSVSANVEGWEEVRVPAGTFKALKVVHSTHWTRYATGNTYSGTETTTFWYSPEAKRWVKYEWVDRAANFAVWFHTRRELIAMRVTHAD